MHRLLAAIIAYKLYRSAHFFLAVQECDATKHNSITKCRVHKTHAFVDYSPEKQWASFLPSNYLFLCASFTNRNFLCGIVLHDLFLNTN
jgi:hypothetical protein